MAGQIVLIVNGVVERDDGDVIKKMRLEMTQFIQHLNRTESHVADIVSAVQADLAGLHGALTMLTDTLDGLLNMTGQVVVDPAKVSALAAQVRENTARIRNLTPPA